jgi:hypothetical protein
LGAIITGIISGVLVVLLGWAAKRAFFSRRLHLVQPKLFDYSGLGPNAQSKTIEVTVINTGRLSEEGIRVEFDPGLRYSVLASSSAGLNVDELGVLKIERLAPRQEVALILMAEGGEFRKEHILSISSKDTVGSIKNSLQEAQTTPAQIVGGLIFFFLLLGIGYGVGKLIEWEVWPNLQQSIHSEWFGTADSPLSFEQKLESISATGDVDEKEKALLSSSVEVRSITRNGKVISVKLRLLGVKGARVSYTLSTATPASERRGDLELTNFDYVEPDVLVFDGIPKELTLTDYLPEAVSPQLVVVDLRAEKGDDSVFWKEILTLTASH